MGRECDFERLGQELLVALECADAKARDEIMRDWARRVNEEYGPECYARVAVYRMIYASGHDTGVDTTQNPVDSSDVIGRPVISIHGIKTKGKWITDLEPELRNHGFEPIAFNYGYFFAIQLLNPLSRRKKVEWFFQEYTKVVGQHDHIPSIVAHSFGSYLVASALEKYDTVRFHRVILCGSIVRSDYSWSTIIDSRTQVAEVLNDVGWNDFWAGIVRWCVNDAGPSGKSGFGDLARDRVKERRNARHRHSDYFNTLHFREHWIPFLKSGMVTPVVPMGRSTNWAYLLAVSALAGLVGLALWMFGVWPVWP